MTFKSWSHVFKAMKPELKGSTGPQTRRRRSAREFVAYAEERGIPLDANIDVICAAYEKTLGGFRKTNGELNATGQSLLDTAREVMLRARGDEVAAAVEEPEQGEVEEVEEEGPPAPAAPSATPKEPMASKPIPPPVHMQEEQFDEEEMLQEEEEVFYEDEPPPPPPKRQQPPQRIRRPGAERAVPRSQQKSAFRDLMPRSEKVRIYKRDELGKRVLIDDYSLDEIGTMPLVTFVKDFIHPEFSNENATTYEFYEVDPRTGREKNPPGTTTLAPIQMSQPGGPIDELRKAMGVMNEMQQMTQQQTPRNPMLDTLQQRAAASGDMNSMMMLMMMERFMGGGGNQQTEVLMKLMDRMDRMEKRGSGGPEFGGPPVPFQPPFPFAPPGFGGGWDGPPRERESNNTKLLDIALAKLANPPSLADTVKELMALQQLMNPRRDDSGEVAQLRQELRQTVEKLASRPAGGIEDMMSNFEKLVTVSKSVGSQVGGSDAGAGGLLKGILSTPKLGETIGQFVSGLSGQVAQPAQVQVAQQHVTQPVLQPPVMPAPRDPNKPPEQPPVAVLDAVRVFRFAQTPEAQAQRFVDVVMAMFLSNDPYYVALLTPAMEHLNKADEGVQFLKVPRQTAFNILTQLKPQLASPLFIDSCIAALANRAGVEKLPDSLLQSRGKWAINNDGEVVMLEEVASPVTEAPPMPPPPASPPIPKDAKSSELAEANARGELEKMLKEPEKVEVHTFPS